MNKLKLCGMRKNHHTNGCSHSPINSFHVKVSRPRFVHKVTNEPPGLLTYLSEGNRQSRPAGTHGWRTGD